MADKNTYYPQWTWPKSPIGCEGLYFRAKYKNRVSVSGWSPIGCECFRTNWTSHVHSPLLWCSANFDRYSYIRRAKLNTKTREGQTPIRYNCNVIDTFSFISPALVNRVSYNVSSHQQLSSAWSVMSHGTVSHGDDATTRHQELRSFSAAAVDGTSIEQKPNFFPPKFTPPGPAKD